MATTDELLDNLMNNCKKAGDLVGESSLLSQLFRTTLQTGTQNGRAEQKDGSTEQSNATEQQEQE